MSRRIPLLVAGAALATLSAGALATAAYAQANDRSEPRRIEREVRIERDGDRVIVRRDHRDPAERLRNLLQLRPEQEPALTAYLEAMKPKMRVGRLDATEERPDTTPEKLARMEQRLAERQAAERARIEAVRRFYVQLDPRQKKAFDELPLMMGPGLIGGPMRPMRIRLPDLERPRVHFPADRFAPEPPEPPAPPAPPRL
jgi:hypothetical protein